MTRQYFAFTETRHGVFRQVLGTQRSPSTWAKCTAGGAARGWRCAGGQDGRSSACTARARMTPSTSRTVGMLRERSGHKFRYADVDMVPCSSMHGGLPRNI